MDNFGSEILELTQKRNTHFLRYRRYSNLVTKSLDSAFLHCHASLDFTSHVCWRSSGKSTDNSDMRRYLVRYVCKLPYRTFASLGTLNGAAWSYANDFDKNCNIENVTRPENKRNWSNVLDKLFV